MQDASLRLSKNIAVDLRPWTQKPAVRYSGLGRVGERVRCLLDLATADRLGPRADDVVRKAKATGNWHEVDKAMKGVFIDLSQNPARRPWTNQKNVSKCLTTSSRIYSFEEQRVVLPLEHLLFQGHRRSIVIPESMPPRSVARLAGEGICLPSLATIVWSLACSGNLAGKPSQRS